jgi:hypothetical protein
MSLRARRGTWVRFSPPQARARFLATREMTSGNARGCACCASASADHFMDAVKRRSREAHLQETADRGYQL